MSGPHPAVAATRVAVRRALTGPPQVPAGALVLTACSGGADSLALAAALAFEAPRLGLRAGAVVVDHRLQPGSGRVAAAAAEQCRGLGLQPVEVLAVEVGTRGGPEAAAREARYRALQQTAARSGAAHVLLGHTRDDQAEQVLLGLVRGSGARSLSGMPRARGPLLRPLLELDRSVTAAACRAQGLRVWQDPHNDDPSYRRVRARRLLQVMEDELGPGVAAALARSADLLREDADHLDALAGTAYRELGPPPWDCSVLAQVPRPVRMRVWRLLAAEHRVPLGDLSATHLRAVDDLVAAWRGQGPVDLPGQVRVLRAADQVWLRPRAAAGNGRRVE